MAYLRRFGVGRGREGEGGVVRGFGAKAKVKGRES